MMTFASTDIMSWVGAFLWPLFRVAALVTAAPVFGARTVPMRIKLVFALMITFVIMPVLPAPPAVDPLSGEAVLITLNQILIGVAMGLALRLIFAMFVLGGQIIAYQMGLGFATMVDPTSGTTVPVISQFYVIMLTLIFFALDGHLVFIDVVAESFRTLPIGMQGLSRDGMWQLAVWGGNMYAGAVQIALPAIASLLLINLTFGIVTRSAPQFNIFSLGFPIAILAGFFIMMLTMDVISAQVSHQLTIIFEFMRWLAGG
ncbi:Flagellar biosynthesis protein FliR [hydrothermal vent metagenome]|uniref:Flagellar biosynthesis protein FliR n=1 Tax=hydrothermal vent metagenome TaxID=652676 RepID=A0A3B1ADQ2_9ZZZZ